jgi:hypothetical protein
MQQSRAAPKTRWFTPAAAVALSTLLALGAAGCGDDNGPTAPRVSLGTYTLVSVNGAALPFTVPNTGSDTVVVQSATLTLTELSTYTVSVEGTQNSEATSVLSDEGTFSQRGSEVTFQSTRFAAAAYAGTTNGNTLTITLPAVVFGAPGGTLEFEFQKQ